MRRKIHNIFILIIFLMAIFSINTVNANDLIDIMKIYKLKINLLNLETDDYTIELIDNISNRIYEIQDGNKNGEHNFAIATDMDKRCLVNYGIKVKFKNGEVKNFDSINIDKLIDVDDNKNDYLYNYEYNVRVKLFTKNVITGFFVILGVIALVILIIYLKKHKRRIK